MSIKITPTVNIDVNAISNRIKKAVRTSMPQIAEDIMKDCNQYAPDRSGVLRGTTQNELNPHIECEDNHAKITWGTPYASYVYKGLSKSGKPLKYTKDRNQEAQSHWVEKAQEMHGAEWEKQAEKAIKKNFKNNT